MILSRVNSAEWKADEPFQRIPKVGQMKIGSSLNRAKTGIESEHGLSWFDLGLI